MGFEISEEDICAFERDGAICLRQVFSPEWLSKVAKGIDTNMEHPSTIADFLKGPSGTGIFFNDFDNWRRIPEIKDYVLNSPAAALAGQIMRSSKSVFYHEHVLVKEGGTSKKTPWHTDISYYPFEGSQCVSIWMPVDRAEIGTGHVTYVAGSHKWPQWFMPRKFATSINYVRVEGSEGNNNREWVDVPTDEALEKEKMLEWSLNPGDCLVFHMRTLHAAAENSSTFPRRVLSTRWLGDDAVIASRPWKVLTPVTGTEVGQPAASDQFPTIWTKSN